MEELDFDFIKEKIKDVLKNAHADPRKHNIKDFNDRINFACPICGDSNKDPNKKRANIYKGNPLFMVCFNDGCRASVTNLFNRYNVQLTPEKNNRCIIMLIVILNSTIKKIYTSQKQWIK